MHIQEQQASDIDWKIHEEYVLVEMVVPPGKVSRPASIIIAAMITQNAVSKATEENAGRRVYYWRRSPGRAGIGAYENARCARVRVRVRVRVGQRERERESAACGWV